MDEQAFRARLKDLGYGEPKIREYEPNRRGELHAHEFCAILLVIRGSFSLAYENATIACRPGEIHEVPAGVRHDERAGPDGATVLLATK